MTSNEGYYDWELDSPYRQGSSTLQQSQENTQYEQPSQREQQKQRRKMRNLPILPSTEYPFSNPRCYDDHGNIKVGTFKWTPDPSEGPYRPFIMDKTRSGYVSHAKVMAKNDEELKKEMDQTESKLKCFTFVCCFLCALQGFKHLKKAREFSSTGNDVEARDALLDAKIKQAHSKFAGLIICWGIFMGVFLIVLLPFIWIPYLIVVAA